MRPLIILSLIPLAGCAARTPPAPTPSPTVAPAVEASAPAVVWTREPGVALAAPVPGAVPFVATRLDVLEATADSFRVRCGSCAGGPEGWIPRARVTWEEGSPADARQGGLAEFMVALRAAAGRREWDALRAVMSRSFVHTIPGPDGTLEAIGAWRGARAGDLARLPSLLDRGAALVPGTELWAAPPEFATVRGYAELRAGFVRGPAGWEWVFLVRDER